MPNGKHEFVMHDHNSFPTYVQVCTQQQKLEFFMHLNLVVSAKPAISPIFHNFCYCVQTWTYVSFHLNCRLLFITSNSKIHSFTPVLSIRIVLDSFYLTIFFSEKFSTLI